MEMNDIDIFHIPLNQIETDRDMPNYNFPMDGNSWMVDRNLEVEIEQ
jgi:hypothetical protein